MQGLERVLSQLFRAQNWGLREYYTAYSQPCSSEEESEQDHDETLSGLDKATKKKLIRRRNAIERIIQVMEKQQIDSGEPESRAYKMQKQLRKDKLNVLLTTFENSLTQIQTDLSEKHTLLKYTTEKTSSARIDSATKVLTDLEKRLFDSERERVHLRREIDVLQRDMRIGQEQREKTKVSSEVLEMCRLNQQRVEESNRLMREMVERQEAERREREELWARQIVEIREAMMGQK